MKHIIILSALALCLSVCSMTATAQNVTIQKQGGVGHVYEIEQVDSVVYFPIGDAEQFPATETENTTTLWDIIKAQPNLRKFAAIMEAATYYTAKSQPTSLHFSQVLDGSIPLSIYAPSDAAISDALYYRMLNLASTDGWKLQQEFIVNHISYQEFFSADEDDAVTTMLNGKLFDNSVIKVLSSSSAAAAGNLFVIASILPYTPNLQEYLLELAPNCGLAQQFMSETSKTYVDNTKSIIVPSMNGGPQILDSVYSSLSPIFDPFFIDDELVQAKGIGADLTNEKANYNMVMPTDQVWNDAQAKLAKHFIYSGRYEDKIIGDMGITSTPTISIIDNPDSLSALAVGADILVPLFGRSSPAQTASLSNGTAYTETTWPVPASEYKPDVEVEIEDTTFFYNVTGSKYKIGSDSRCIDFDNDRFADITNNYGRVSNNNFFYLGAYSATKGPSVELKLLDKSGAQVMSGKYDVQVVIVPHWYIDIADASEIAPIYLDADSLDSIAAINKQKFRATLSYCNNATKDRTIVSKHIEYNGFVVDTLTVLEDFEFPYSYKNIHRSYPTLYLECTTASSNAKNGFLYSLCIDKIILRSKEDGSEIEVTP